MDDAELVELGQNLRRGVPIATPVFNGAKEADIERLLEQAGLHSSGQSRCMMAGLASPSTAR
jgi:DNA-directed RNA polymerase subunit beta